MNFKIYSNFLYFIAIAFSAVIVSQSNALAGKDDDAAKVIQQFVRAKLSGVLRKKPATDGVSPNEVSAVVGALGEASHALEPHLECEAVPAAGSHTAMPFETSLAATTRAEIEKARITLIRDPSDPELYPKEGDIEVYRKNKLLQQLPFYRGESAKEKIASLYMNVEKIGNGGTAHVFKVKLTTPIAALRLAREDSIAVRVQGHALAGNPGAIAFARLAVLREYGKDKKPVTDFIPAFYGAFYGPYMGKDAGELPDSTMTYQEMELVDSTLKDLFEKDQKLSESFIFEYCLGEWAIPNIGKVHIGDYQDSNYGVKRVGYYRVYHVGKEIYALPPGDTPRRLDLDYIRDGSQVLLKSEQIPEICKKMVKEHSNVPFEKDHLSFFHWFSEVFSSFKTNPITAETFQPSKHYYIPDDYLPSDLKSHTTLEKP